ncbi:MAG: NAD(P)H-dependent flavin oxidoreductase [Dethiobacteria bacterium]
MKFPPLQLGDIKVRIPIIQGGMGIGISRSRLAAAVAEAGGIGTISAVQAGFREADFERNTRAANIRGLKKEIKRARELCANGTLAVNILTAINDYKEMVVAAVEEKIDLIVSGAGLPRELPALIKGTRTKIAPIVSSGKAAKLLAKLWDRKFNYAPDLVIVEGTEAGGHLGFPMSVLNSEPKPDLKALLLEVINALAEFEQKYQKKIPVVAAGGIFDGRDIAAFMKLGAAGVQLATRFVTTEECDAHGNFKLAYLRAGKEDLQLVKSPVGMPGRAIRNKFIAETEKSNLPVERCYNCLRPCDLRTTPYCISRALINAVNGDTENGLIFAGSNVYRLHKLTTVKELMHELVTETEACLVD